MPKKEIRVGTTASNKSITINNENSKTIILGDSGQGKSVTLVNLVIAKILKGENGLLIDPYGDLVENIQNYVPADKIMIFNVKKGGLKMGFDEFKRHSNKFFLFDLDYSVIGSHAARNIGIQIIKEFLKSSKDNQNLISICLDEAYNFLDQENLEKLISKPQKNLSCILVDQSLKHYDKKTAKKLLNQADNLISYKADKRTARWLNEILSLKTNAKDINQMEYYHFLIKTKDGENIAKSIFPLSYEKYL